MTRRLPQILCALLLAAPALAAPSPDGNWWVIVGNSPDPEYLGMERAGVDHGIRAAKRCGVIAEPDFSGKWTGFAPGFSVAVAGGYETRREAIRVLKQVRRCVPSAYIRSGSYAGD